MSFAIHVREGRAKEAVLSAVLALPSDVARFASECVAFVGVGETARGLAVAPSRRWIIVLDEREPDAATVAHEIAHAWMGHRGREVNHERQAAALARSWGAQGSAADPDSCARRFRPEERGTFRCRVEGDELHVACDCGNRSCCVTRANAPGAVLVTCVRCMRRELFDVNELPSFVCPCCGVEAAVSMVRDGLPALLAWRVDGARGVFSWARRGMRGLTRWVRRGCPAHFAVKWMEGDVLAVRCGTCARRSKLRIAARGSASRRAEPPSPEEAGAGAKAPVSCPGSH